LLVMLTVGILGVHAVLNPYSSLSLGLCAT